MAEARELRALAGSIAREGVKDALRPMLFVVSLNTCLSLALQIGDQARSLAWVEELCAALDTLAQAGESSELRLARARAHRRRGEVLALDVRFADALAAISHARTLLTPWLERAPRDRSLDLELAQCAQFEAAALENLGRSDEAQDLLRGTLARLAAHDDEVDIALTRCEIMVRLARLGADEPRRLLRGCEEVLLGLAGKSPEVPALLASVQTELGWLAVAAGDPAEGLERALVALDLREQRRAARGQLEDVRRCIHPRMLAYHCQYTAGNHDAARELGWRLWEDYVQLLDDPRVRASDRHDALAFAAAFALHRMATEEPARLRELCTRGLAAARAYLDSGVAVDPQDFTAATQLVTAQLVVALRTEDLAAQLRLEREAVALIREGIARCGPLPSLEAPLAGLLFNLADGLVKHDAIAEARVVMDEALGLAERLGDAGLAGRCRLYIRQLEARGE